MTHFPTIYHSSVIDLYHMLSTVPLNVVVCINQLGLLMSICLAFIKFNTITNSNILIPLPIHQ